MPIIPIAEYRPDAPDLATATDTALNVVPVTPESYGPIRTLAPFSDTSNITCPAYQILGMGAASNSTLTEFVFAGINAKLYVLPGGDVGFTDVSGTAYTAFPENWRFAQFNNKMLATDFIDPIQSYTMGGGGIFGNLAAAAPKARHIAVAKNFVIVANTYDPTGLYNPARVWWSANNDPTNWPTPGSLAAQQVQSDYNDLNGPMGAIMGLAPNLAGCDCAVLFERGVFRMIYSGPPQVFDFYPAASVRGTTASNSIVNLSQMVFYLGEDGFYAFDGSTAIPIGANKVDKWFLANADLTTRSYSFSPNGALWNNEKLVIGAADVNNKTVCWIFRLANDPMPANGFPEPTMMLIYRWDIQRWSISDIPAQWIARVPTPNTTTPSSTAPLSISRGHLQLSAMGSLAGGTVSSFSFYNGPYALAKIASQCAQLSPGNRSFIRGIRPLVDGGVQSIISTQGGVDLTTETGVTIWIEDPAPAITVAIASRTSYQNSEVYSAEVAPDLVGNCSFREDGRYQRVRVTVTSNNASVWEHCAGFDLDFIGAGQR